MKQFMMWVLRIASATMVFAVVLTESFAQTPEQLNSLTPAQREALLDQLNPQQGQTDPQLEFPGVVVPAAEDDFLGFEDPFAPPELPRLMGGDTLVIEFAEAEGLDVGSPRSGLSGDEEILIDRLMAGNPYELDLSLIHI